MSTYDRLGLTAAGCDRVRVNDASKDEIGLRAANSKELIGCN